MHPVDIQGELKKKHILQKDIAKKKHVSDMAVSLVIRKLMVSDQIMRAVAEALGIDHRRVFPEHYNQRPKRKTSKVAAM